MLNRRHRRRGASTALLIVALACGLGSDGQRDPGSPGLAPVPTQPGAPIGPPTSKTISTEGGTLSTEDGALSISVPPGAVTSPTELTITPIANTARGAVAGAFRLGPEGVTFAAPVTLTFKGPAQYPTGGSVDDVGVHYQDRNGFWLTVEPATRDRALNTVSVTTDHFSDWALAWTTGIPVADGPIRLDQTLEIPFAAQGRATVYLRDDSSSFTSYVLAGTLTAPATITLGSEVCVPDQTTKSWANIAEVDKAKNVFRWGVGAQWTLTCTAADGRQTQRFMPALFDTMGINLSRCAGAYDPGQFAEPEFLKGAYTTDCGYEGMVRGTWDLRGYQVLVNPTSGLVTTEAGGTATFEIALNKPPAGDVTIPLSTSDASEGTVPASVTFTPNDWSTPQTVTVTGVNDPVDDDDVPYTVLTAAAISTDPRYQGIDGADVEVTNVDDDVAGLALDPATGLVTNEAGGTATFVLTLTSEPVADVIVTLSSSDTTEGTVGPASYTFTAANWNVARTVTLTGVSDSVDDGDVAYTVDAAAASADPKYQGLAGSASATNQNDDFAGYSLVPAAGLVTTEAGGTATFQLSLMSEPTGPVTVGLSTGDPSEGTVSPASVVFTATDWRTSQTITVTGVNDPITDGDQAYAVRVGPAAGGGYDAVAPVTVAAVNSDDEVPGLALSTPDGTSTSEAGTTARIVLALTAQPTGNVTIPISSSDLTEATVSAAEVVFTPTDWNVPQDVIVTGLDDFETDGDVVYQVRAGPPTGGGYEGVAAVDAALMNADDDVGGLSVTTPLGATTTEAGGTATVRVVLAVQPSGTVTVPVGSLDGTEGTTGLVTSLTFTTSNWDIAQDVIVAGVDDAETDGDVGYAVRVGPPTGGGYDGVAFVDAALTNADDDSVSVTNTGS